jgi:hypothetical protein
MLTHHLRPVAEFQLMKAITRFTKDDPCPFENRRERIVKATQLNAYDKEWLGAQIHFRKISAYQLSLEHGFPRTTLTRYHKKLINGDFFHHIDERLHVPLLNKSEIVIAQCPGTGLFKHRTYIGSELAILNDILVKILNLISIENQSELYFYCPDCLQNWCLV